MSKKYVLDLVKKEKHGPSKSPYGALLLCVEENDKKLQGTFDYLSSNRVTKINNTHSLRSDEMLGRLGDAPVLSKLDLKT